MKLMLRRAALPAGMVMLAGLLHQANAQFLQTRPAINIVSNSPSYLPIIGGPGGGEFQSFCGGGYVTGLALRVGDDVDAVRPICANPDGTVTGPSGNWSGGPGGRPLELVCPPAGQALVAIDIAAEGARTVIVNNIHLYCSPPSPSARPPAQPTAVFDGPAAVPAKAQFPSVVSGSPIRYSQGKEACPAGQIATGILSAPVQKSP